MSRCATPFIRAIGYESYAAGGETLETKPSQRALVEHLLHWADKTDEPDMAACAYLTALTANLLIR